MLMNLWRGRVGCEEVGEQGVCGDGRPCADDAVPLGNVQN